MKYQGDGYSEVANTTQISATVATVQNVLPLNTNRAYVSMVNNSTVNCFVLFGTGVVSASLFSIMIPPLSTSNGIVPTGFKGVITCIFASAGTGNLNVTEFL